MASVAINLNLDRILLPLLFVVICVVSCLHTTEWPQPHRKYERRPPIDSYCQAGIVGFCPTGYDSIPTFDANDTIHVFAMKKPVWQFKFGSRLKKLHVAHDGMGFHNVDSGQSLTMEFYGLFQLINGTFPQLPRENELLWCNQGGSCAFPGIDLHRWKDNGTVVKITEITGEMFNQFVQWVVEDNSTYPFYEIWTVMDKPGGQLWFESLDCASWVLRAYQTLSRLGADFNPSIHLNFTRMTLYSREPQDVGDSTTIYDNPALLRKLYDQYSYFREPQYMTDPLQLLRHFEDWFTTHGYFYLFYNEHYWRLTLQPPHLEITYDEVPFPVRNSAGRDV